jgi:hypothetical protein
MAASTRQIEANRRNAAGPHQMTEAGKQSIRTNAIRHGLACNIHVVLPGEDQEFFNEVLASLQTDYAPASAQEEMLVHQIAGHHWRLIRARNMETASFGYGLRKLSQEFPVKLVEPDDVARGENITTALSRYDNIFWKVSRYETTVERSYYRAIRELQKIQAQTRRVTPQPTADIQPAPETTHEIRSVPQSEESTTPAPEKIRSVPQNTQSAATREPESLLLTMGVEAYMAYEDKRRAERIREQS